MKDQPTERQIRLLRNSVERLNRIAGECADMMRNLNAALEKIALRVESSESDLREREVTVQTVHGVRQKFKLRGEDDETTIN